ncbi:GDP-6-deoxy-D-mannose reductase [compost metagenome]
MKILVTGSNGFVGKHVLSELAIRYHEIISGITDEKGFDSDKEIFLDVRSKNNWEEVIKAIKPDAILHLAAQSMVQKAWVDPSDTILTNTLSALFMIESVQKYSPTTKIINVGSSEEYGLAGLSGQPLTEDTLCNPQNPYAVSKHSAGQLIMQISKKNQLNTIHLRPFNHFGPGQREGFVISDFSSQICRIEKGIQEPIIRVGNLDARRDFTDVRDIVRAYVDIIEKDIAPGIYNVCSQVPRRIADILEFLIAESKVPITLEVDEARFRPSEVSLFIGSNLKILESIGWKPSLKFEESLRETLNWWRQTYAY